MSKKIQIAISEIEAIYNLITYGVYVSSISKHVFLYIA